MEANYTRDIAALNNYLQGHSSGNLAPFLTWTLVQEGPSHQTVHTAIAKFCDVVVGQGKGASRGLAKSAAAMEALRYFRERGFSRFGPRFSA